MSSTNRLAGLLHATATELRTRFDKSAIASKHAGSKGAVREDYLTDFLREHLPRTVDVYGSAEIVTADGQISPQCDVLITDPATPPFFSEDRHRVVPNECVYGMIEVKSRLDTAELHDACQKIARVRGLPKTAYYPTRPPFTYKVQAYGRTWSHWPTAGMIFAFDSMNLDMLAARLMDWCREHDPIEWPDSVWVLGKGCLLWKPLGAKPIDYAPEPESGLVALAPLPGNDILLPMLLNLHPLLARATMPSFRLIDYASTAQIGTLVAHLPWNPTNNRSS
ncbi:DUF6602 domain-containing protein [Actinokineospora sp. G85]|uniref:DUF6602 domain-containing protein n=1 Tax=Actinokineospora sp. G85 TaxID=3406626 RepID=UPI003C75CEAB